MAKIADARAASTISSPILSLFLGFPFLLFLRTLGLARFFSTLCFHCTATLSDSPDLIFISSSLVFPPTGSETQKPAELMSPSIAMEGVFPLPLTLSFLCFICALEPLVG
jgi:hypothetical protein